MATTDGDRFVDEARRSLQRLLAKVEALADPDLREAATFDVRDAIDNVDAVARMVDQVAKKAAAGT